MVVVLLVLEWMKPVGGSGQRWLVVSGCDGGRWVVGAIV